MATTSLGLSFTSGDSRDGAPGCYYRMRLADQSRVPRWLPRPIVPYIDSVLLPFRPTVNQPLDAFSVSGCDRLVVWELYDFHITAQ